MKRISAYQATDGKMFHANNGVTMVEARTACKAHQAHLNLAERLGQVAEQLDNDSCYYNEDAGFNAITSVSDLTEFLVQNADALRAILNGVELPVEEQDDATEELPSSTLITAATATKLN